MHLILCKRGNGTSSRSSHQTYRSVRLASQALWPIRTIRAHVPRPSVRSVVTRPSGFSFPEHTAAPASGIDPRSVALSQRTYAVAARGKSRGRTYNEVALIPPHIERCVFVVVVSARRELLARLPLLLGLADLPDARIHTLFFSNDQAGTTNPCSARALFANHHEWGIHSHKRCLAVRSGYTTRGLP